MRQKIVAELTLTVTSSRLGKGMEALTASITTPPPQEDLACR